jgi:transcriptional regulator with XRE-family HTH domain
MILTRLGEKMKGHMRAEELAVKSGLSFNTIRKAMKGEEVSAGTAALIAQGMKMKKEDLV